MTEVKNIVPCLTKKEVAQRLNVSLRKVDYMIAGGDLVGFYIGKCWRMKPEHLERWMEKRERV